MRRLLVFVISIALASIFQVVSSDPALAYGGNFNCVVGQPVQTACGTNFFGLAGSNTVYQARGANATYDPANFPIGVSFNSGQTYNFSSRSYEYTPTLTGTITGTVGTTYSFGFYYGDCYFSCTQRGVYNLTVVSATPSITSASTASGSVGSTFSTYTITATATPTSYNATGLPAGLAINTANGQITGTPTAYGTSTVTISATNAAGTGNATLTITIAKGTPTITWATPSSITYGTALSSTQLNATASVPGTFTYSPALGTILSVGTTTLSTAFTPTDTTNYNSVASRTVSQVVTAQPALTPAFGSPTSAVGGFTASITNHDPAFTWNASATSGSASINSATGLLTVTGLSTGGSSTITVTTTRTGYTSGSASVSGSAIAIPVVSSSITASGTVGSTFSTYTITATATPTSYNATGLPAGLGINTANGQITGTPTAYGTSTVTISATNAAGTGNATLTITIAKGTPTITWATPSSITYGTALSSTQLNATASVPGTFTYSPALGTILSVGTTTLSTAFTPTDTTNYNSVATTTVSQSVGIATQSISWSPALSMLTTDTPMTFADAITDGTGAITYAVTDPGTSGCALPSVGQPILTFTSEGLCQVTATATATSTHASTTMVRTFSIGVPIPSNIPDPISQAFGKPVLGTCDAAQPDGLNWSGVPDGGWGESWAQWMNGGTGGFVCTRTLVYSSTQATWILG